MVGMKDILLWLKVFVVSFIVIAAFRYFIEEQLGYGHNWFSIALTASLVAIAIATAQWVLSPTPKNKAIMQNKPQAAKPKKIASKKRRK
jgi:hypothetical protein